MSTKISRRDFSRLVAATPVTAAVASAAEAMPTRTLGKTGFQAGILGLGAQRIADRPLEQSAVDRLLAEGIDNGMNYIDTARGYGTSEELLGPALKGRRDRVFLVSKTRSNSYREAMQDIEQGLRLLQTDRIDCYHLHNISRDDRFPDLGQTLSEKGPLGALIDAKKQGKIKHIGCTSHLKPARVLEVFATGHIDVFMCTINFVERHIYNYEETVLPEARRRGIAVIGMKVLGGPTDGPKPRLASPEDYQATLRYAWSVPGVAVAIVGMRSIEELRQGLDAARKFKPLSTVELSRLAERGRLMAAQWGPLRGPVA
jgi:uncharacterized protein